MAHLAVVAICIVLINYHESGEIDVKDPHRAHFWYVNVLQFFFGGLLSTYLVFYFRSATLSVTWPFILILAAAFIANESFKRSYTRLTFQISLFFLSLLSFAIFFVPVLFHRVGQDIFFISSAASLAVLLLYLFGLGFFARNKFRQSKKILALSILGILLTTNGLYFLNLIPPIPLSLKDAGIYHAVFSDGQGNYTAKTEAGKKWFSYFAPQDDIHIVGGSATLYAYSAVFSPTLFKTDIVHEWQKYDAGLGQWVAEGTIPLKVTGGREGGYRVYSFKRYITPGQWRVNVETLDDKIIGRLRFDVISVSTEPVLMTEVKN